MFRVFPYNPMSASGRALQDALAPAFRVITEQRYPEMRIRPEDVVINWGWSKLPQWFVRNNRQMVINEAGQVGLFANKKTFFQMEAPLYRRPAAIFNSEDLRHRWTDGETWVARTELNGHSGEGIVMVTNPLDIPAAQLYTRYIKKSAEFRIHFFNGRIFDIQRKVRRADIPNEAVDWQVRTHANGFNYARNDIQIPPDVTVQANSFLDHRAPMFGAIDIIYNKQNDRAYVLEINCAPGLEGTTLQNYKQQFLNWQQQQGIAA